MYEDNGGECLALRRSEVRLYRKLRVGLCLRFAVVPVLISMTAGDGWARIFDENPTIRTVFYDRIFEKTRCGETKIVLVGVEEREEGAKNRRFINNEVS